MWGTEKILYLKYSEKLKSKTNILTQSIARDFLIIKKVKKRLVKRLFVKIAAGKLQGTERDASQIESLKVFLLEFDVLLKRV